MESKNSSNLAQWVEQYTGDLYSWALHKISDRELADVLVTAKKSL